METINTLNFAIYLPACLTMFFLFPFLAKFTINIIFRLLGI